MEFNTNVAPVPVTVKRRTMKGGALWALTRVAYFDPAGHEADMRPRIRQQEVRRPVKGEDYLPAEHIERWQA